MKAELPFNAPLYKNSRGLEIKDARERATNCLENKAGRGIKRPGLEEALTVHSTSAGCQGLYYWEDKDCVIGVWGGVIYRIDKVGTTNLIKTALGGVALNALNKVSFDASASTLYMCNGSQIAYTDGTTAPAFLADADAPTAAIALALLDSYLIATDGTGVKFSEVEDPATWSALDEFFAVGNPDRIQNIVVQNRRLFVFGSRSTEIWYNDGQTPFVRLDGGYVDRGFPYDPRWAFVKHKYGVIGLDNEKRFVNISASATFEPIAQGGDILVKSISALNQGRGFNLQVEDYDLAVFSFPLAHATIVYDIEKQRWFEWAEYDYALGTFNTWRVSDAVNIPRWNMVLAGAYQDGVLYKVHFGAYKDGDSDIYIQVRTEHIDHGTDEEKLNNTLSMKFSRGTGTPDDSSVAPKALLKWRDDGESEWGNPYEIDLGSAGQSEIHKTIWSTGAYVSRQYELTVHNVKNFQFWDVREDYEVIG